MTSFVEMMRYRYEQAPTAGRVVTVEQLLAEAERPPAPAAGDFWSKVWPGLDEREYHADPCPVPSLSHSMAVVLDQRSPAHAYDLHPRLGGGRREQTDSMALGALVHALVLGGSEVVEIEAGDWKTKEARARRDEVRAAGKIAVLSHELAVAEVAADAIRRQATGAGVNLEACTRELSLFWPSEVDDTLIQCRARLDAIDIDHAQRKVTVVDLKTCRTADPDSCARHVEAFGYSIQHATYVEAVSRLALELNTEGYEIDFLFLFAEASPPYAVTPARLSPTFELLGARRWERAKRTWVRCLRENDWPTYTTGVVELDPPEWAIRDEEGRRDSWDR